MIKTEFCVYFSNGSYEPEFVRVYALSLTDAVILAKAERIRIGRDHTLLKVEEEI